MKAITLVLCILALLGSAASGFFWFETGNAKKDLQAKLVAEQTRTAETQAKLAESITALESETAKLAESDASLGDTKIKLTASEARNIQNNRETANFKTLLASKEETVNKLNAELDTLRRDLVQARVASASANPDEIESYKQAIAALETKVEQLQTAPISGTTNTATVASSGPSQEKPALSERTSAARVASVGIKNSFVVLELGTSDGISAGQKFNIVRNGTTIAESKVSEVKATFAIAHILPSSIKTTLKTGDTATYVN
jgi:ribosomal protein L29